MSPAEVKAELRQFVRLTRGARTESERAVSEVDFTAHLAHLADQFSWRRVAAFLPVPTEPPIAGALESFVRGRLTVIVPVATADGLLEWRELDQGATADTETDSMGMPIPSHGRSTPPLDLDAVLVPAAAVDRDGHRLGWGKGYYDRFLQSVVGDPLVVAVVFDADIVDDIPMEEHDIPVDAIVTEASITFIQ